MNEKLKKRIVAITIGAVLLFVILFALMGYGLVKILIINREIDNLKERVSYYQSLTQEEKEIAIAAGEKAYIIQEARKLDYKDPLDLD